MPDRRHSAYRLRRRINFYEADPAGLVHFSCFFRYMEEAEHALWLEAGLGFAPEGGEISFPRVAAACEYHSPLRFGDECDVWLRVAAIGEKSIRYTCLFSRGDTRVATGTVTVVCVVSRPGEPLRSIPIPPEIRERFEVAPEADVLAFPPR